MFPLYENLVLIRLVMYELMLICFPFIFLLLTAFMVIFAVRLYKPLPIIRKDETE
jgi:hypothetical protein